MEATKELTKLCFYKTVEERGNFGKDLERISLVLKKFLYPELEVSQALGGRSGDLWKQTVRYVLFIGGSENVWNNGNFGGIYQLTLDDTSGTCQHISVIVHLREDEEGKLMAEEIMRVLDELNFAPKFSYLRGHHELKSSFRRWLNELVMPITDFRTA